MNEEGLEAGLNFTDLAAEIVSAYVSNNPVPPADLPALIAQVHAAVSNLSLAGGSGAAAADAEVEKPKPAQVRKSVRDDGIMSFIDGKPYKTLKRHLTLRGITPEVYREKWGLPRDYPMTAASYSETRSKLAMALGLGQKNRKQVAPNAAGRADAVSEKPKPAGRPRKVKEAAGA